MDINEKDAERLMSRVSISIDGCWEWHGSKNNAGYGVISIKNKQMLTHRVSFAIHNNGEEPTIVMHLCDNRSCINPAHLRGGTQKDNVRDMMDKGRGVPQKEFCQRGHNNWMPQGKNNRGRQCRTCSNDRNKEYKRRKRDNDSLH